MKKLTALILAVMVLSCLLLSGCQSQTVDGRDSVVMVFSVFEDKNYGTIPWGTGTGFFVGEDGENPKYLITNYHVIEEYVTLGSGELISRTAAWSDGSTLDLYGRSTIRVYFDSSDFEEAFLVAGDEAKDIAILKLASETTKRIPLALRVADESDVGKPIRAIGYPGMAENDYADSITAYGKRDATVTTGSISRFITTSGTGREDIQVDCQFSSGNSGGPLLDENGACLGITSWHVYQQSDSHMIHYAISISEAIPMLNQYSVPYTMAKMTINLKLLLVIAAAVVVVVLVVVLLVVLLTKKKASKKKAIMDSITVPVTPKTLRPVVRSMARVNAGAMAEVRGKLVIGRSSACGLQFPDGTPGVSGNHCVVEYDAATGDFIVTDIGSSYGTYVNGGEKLVPHVPRRLLPRDRMSLGNMENVVIVDLVEV